MSYSCHYLYSSKFKRIGNFQRQRFTWITYDIYVKTWAQSCKSVHFVDFRFETFFKAYFLAVTTFDSTWRIIDQSANVFITISTTSTTTLSISWYVAEPALITIMAFVWILLTFATFVCTCSIIVTLFCILTWSITWSAASNVRWTVTKTTVSASSTKVVIPI